MMIRTLKILTLLLALAIYFVPVAEAGIYGESVGIEDLHDQRTFSDQPQYDPGQSEGGLSGYWPSFYISWDISYDSNAALWHYEYNLASQDKDISLFILEVSPTAQSDDIMNIFVDGSPANIYGPELWKKAGNHTIPNPIYGVKFDYGGSSVSYAFDSTLDPVWGNYYAKDGVDGGDQVKAYNNALAMDDFESDNPLDFIVRPNGEYTVPHAPEPVSSILFITGGAMLGFRRLRKRVS